MPPHYLVKTEMLPLSCYRKKLQN